MAISPVSTRLVKNLKGAGFWRNGTEASLHKAIQDLKSRGFTDEEASEFVENLWWAVKGEYGE